MISSTVFVSVIWKTNNIGDTINVFAYTDDVALLAENREDLTACAEQLLIDGSLSSTAQGQ